MKAYLSHCIRGAKGLDATPEDIEKNCKKAIEFANKLRKNLTDLDLYVPAEHEDFVQIAYDKKYVTEEQILDVDCTIIAKCDMVIAFNPECISRGMRVEIDFAEKHDIPVFYTHQLDLKDMKGISWNDTVSYVYVDNIHEITPSLTKGYSTDADFVHPAKKHKFKVGDLVYGTIWLRKHNKLVLVKLVEYLTDHVFKGTAIHSDSGVVIKGQTYTAFNDHSWEKVERITDEN